MNMIGNPTLPKTTVDEYPAQWRNWNTELAISLVVALSWAIWYTYRAHQLALSYDNVRSSLFATSQCVATADRLLFLRSSCTGCTVLWLAEACANGCSSTFSHSVVVPGGAANGTAK